MSITYQPHGVKWGGGLWGPTNSMTAPGWFNSWDPRALQFTYSSYTFGDAVPCHKVNGTQPCSSEVIPGNVGSRWGATESNNGRKALESLLGVGWGVINFSSAGAFIWQGIDGLWNLWEHCEPHPTVLQPSSRQNVLSGCELPSQSSEGFPVDSLLIAPPRTLAFQLVI